MRDPNNPCLFCNVPSSEYIFKNNLAFSTFDSYPVSKHHALIIPKRHVENYFDMSEEEVVSCNCLLYTSPSPRDRTRSRMPSSA